ncbi:PREDICTED: transmembrane protein 150B [Elephantulus edwardii]|uniref:transmembrane protein 150B n=1 Tax=Elephantulus edwardii TaxID=28737 RepID=UPI0003F091A5|nr:PREDICTED: transmembrane protein 150B [Elephantulus edwardii]
MWSYLILLPMLLALGATAGIWTVFGIAVANKSVNLSDHFPSISKCGSYPPQSCIFSQVLNMGAALAAWVCILRYHQLRDWGVGRRFNQLILSAGLLSVFGTSLVANFQQTNQRTTHLTGAFLAFFVGLLYFWLQLLLSWRRKNLPQVGWPWVGPCRLGLCTVCTVLIVTMVISYRLKLKTASAACEWAAAMLIFMLFGLLAVDFSCLGGCTLSLQAAPGLDPQPPPTPRAPCSLQEPKRSPSLSPHPHPRDPPGRLPAGREVDGDVTDQGFSFWWPAGCRGHARPPEPGCWHQDHPGHVAARKRDPEASQRSLITHPFQQRSPAGFVLSLIRLICFDSVEQNHMLVQNNWNGLDCRSHNGDCGLLSWFLDSAFAWRSRYLFSGDPSETSAFRCIPLDRGHFPPCVTCNDGPKFGVIRGSGYQGTPVPQ